MLVIKDDKILEVSEKAYRIIYRDLGYIKYDPDTHLLSYLEKEIEAIENEATEEPTIEVKEVTNVIDYDDMTKAEIGELLSERGIDYNPRDNKTKLIDLLLGSD